MTRYADRYREVSRSLRSVELARHSMDASFDLTPMDLVHEDPRSRRWLDFYGDEGILLGLERYGILNALRRRGYDGFTLDIEPNDDRHTLLVHAQHIGGGPPSRLVELVVRRDTLVLEIPPGESAATSTPPPTDVLTIDWLCLQNPHARFTSRRPRAPGQAYPGLGIGEQVLELLHRVVARLELGGLLTVAEYFHNAVLYSRELPFLDPESMGELDTLSNLLLETHRLTLTQASWAIHWGYVTRDDSPFTWRGEAQVGPRARALRDWLASRRWQRQREHAARSIRFSFDHEAFSARWAAEETDLLSPPPEPDPRAR